MTRTPGDEPLPEKRVQVPPGKDRAEVGLLFGSAEVVVPDDARVRSTGTIVFGSVDIVRQSEADRADD